MVPALLEKWVRGGLIVLGEVTLDRTSRWIQNSVGMAELAGATGRNSLLRRQICRRQLFDLSDYMANGLDSEFNQEARDALLNALAG